MSYIPKTVRNLLRLSTPDLMNLHTWLESAILDETKAINDYKQLASKYPMLRKDFIKIATEEQVHKEYFENLLKKVIATLKLMSGT